MMSFTSSVRPLIVTEIPRSASFNAFSTSTTASLSSKAACMMAASVTLSTISFEGMPRPRLPTSMLPMLMGLKLEITLNICLSLGAQPFLLKPLAPVMTRTKSFFRDSTVPSR